MDEKQRLPTTQSRFSVKVPIEDGDKAEHMWLVPVRFEKGEFIGRINNEPQTVESVKFGDEVEVAREEISDWLYVDGGKLVGGFTVRVLQKRMSKDKPDGPTGSSKPAGEGSDDEISGPWKVVSIDSGAGPQRKDGFELRITGTEIVFVAPSGNKKRMGQIHRIDSTTTPKQLDLKNGDHIGRGIYALDGTTLKLIVRNPGLERPTKFKGNRDGILFTLRR